MKVLHLVPYYYPSRGGSQILFQSLSEELVRCYGDQVTVFTTNAVDNFNLAAPELLATGEECVNGVIVHRFEHSRTFLPLLRKASSAAKRLKMRHFKESIDAQRIGPVVPEMMRAVEQSDADVCAGTPAGMLHMTFAARRARHGRKLPFVNFGALHLEGMEKLSRAARNSIDLCDAYVAYTPFERDYLIEQGFQSDKIHVVGLGVELPPAASDTTRWRREHGLNAAPLIGCIGRQAAYKGIDTLLRAMPTLWQHHPEAQVLIAGARTEYSPHLLEIIASFAPAQQKQIKVLDNFTTAEKPLLFAACDVVSFVSHQESFGLVYLEAWAARKPVIGADIGAVSSLIRHGQDGLLVPYNDEAALADALTQLLSDDGARRAMGERGHQRVLQEYTWDKVTAKVRDIYQSVVEA